MRKNRLFCSLLAVIFVSLSVEAQQVDYSVVYVPEEAGSEFIRITSAGDYVCMPIVERHRDRIDWLTNRILDISKDGTHIAYLSFRNNTSNIFVKELDKQGGSVQRTNRSAVLDFSYSPDGKYICFSEKRGESNQIFQTGAESGYVCRQITSANQDYSPIYSKDMKQIFFARAEANGVSIWSYNIQNSFLSSFTAGQNPWPSSGESVIYCTRMNGSGKTEIWRFDYSSGVEECIISDANRSFASPVLSPDGEWLLFVGESVINAGSFTYHNTDLYVCHPDGSGLEQLTYHAADDLSPIWSRDGRYIYFVSQRGSADATANIWRMNFNY